LSDYTARQRGPYLGAAAFFGAVTVFIAVLFVIDIVRDHEIRSGLFTYGVFTTATVVGLYRRKRWGRSLALVVAMGNFGIGTLVLLSAIMSRQGPIVGPVVLLAISTLAAYVLSRPMFNFTDE
jgi:hypothetical protein